MRKFGILILLITTLLLAKDSSSEDFNLRDFYNKSLESSPQSPNDFQIQDTLGKMYPQEVLDAANSQNPESFYDGNVEKEFGPKTTDPDDTGTRGIGSYLSIQKSGLLDKLKEKTKENLGGIAKSTGRVSCYITRSQSFFKYHCPINNQDYGFSSSNPTDSPLSAKANCEAQCFDPKTTACVAVKPLSGKNDDKEVKQEVFSAMVLSKNQLTDSLNKNFDKNVKVKYFEFSIKNNVDIYLDFSYEDETGFRRVMAKNLLLSASFKNDPNNKDTQEKEISKKFYINSKVSKIHLDFHIGKLTKNSDGKYQYDQVDLSKFADDPNDKEKPQLVIEAKKGILFTPETKRFACRSSDVSVKRHIFLSNDLTDLVADDGTRITIAKSVSSGDNEDGTFSDAGVCSAACRTKQECTLVQPKLNIEEFFGFTEDCADAKDSQCAKQKCIDARENAAPIVNETVYDAQGNAIQTIVNGNVVAGTIRPRLLAKDDKSMYEQKMKEEAKDRAYDKMIKDHRYVTSIPIKNKRETSYAIYTKQKIEKTADGKEVILKNKTVDILIKPGSEFVDKKMYLYVMLTTYTTDINYTITDKKGHTNNYKSRFYAMVKDDGKLDFNFFSEKGIQWLNKAASLQVRNKGQNAPAFRIYDNAFEVIKKENSNLKKGETKKFFLQERLFDDKEDGFNADTSLCNQSRDYGELCPAVVKGYMASDKDGANVSTYSTDGKLLSGILLEKIYKNPGKNLPHKDGVNYLTGDIPIQYTVSILASFKPLTYGEIADKLINSKQATSEANPSPNENEIYNYLENPQPMITELKDDSIKSNDEISIYLFGDNKKLSAYASFKVENVDYKEAGYSYYWWGKAEKDDNNKSIINLEPSKRKPSHYYPELPKKETFIPLFEDLDISNMKNDNLNFGYSSGRYADDDCRVFNTKDGIKNVCLPWWGIEREYAEHKEPIADNKFQEWIKKYELPLVGKLVDVCTKVDPFANKFYNNDKEQKVNCTTYYDKNKSETCKNNPFLRECFVDTCPAKVKESCELFKTNDFDNELPGLFVKNDIRDKDPSNFKKVFSDGKVGLKSYTYKCPAHTGTNINQVCLKEEQVKMNPANCNTSVIGEDGEKEEGSASDDEKIKLKSNYIYCPTNNPIIDAFGNVTGFKGTCPNTKKEVVCGIDQVKQVTKTCVAPIFIDEPYTEVKSEIKNANCQIYSISVVNGEGDDIYKNDPSCLRDNDAADSRKGILNLAFSNKKVPKTFIVTKNYKDTQEDLYCQYDGDKSSKLPSKCKNTTEKGGSFMDFTTIINDSEEIIFAEQIGHLNQGKIDLGFKLNGSGPSEVKTPRGKNFRGDEGFVFLGNVSSAARERISGVYYKEELNFTSQKLTGEIDIHPFILMPESLNSNYRTSKWFERFFDVGKKHNDYLAIDKNKGDKSTPFPDGCHCVSNCNSGNGWSNFFTFNIAGYAGSYLTCDYDHWAFSANKVYENSTLGLNILLPTPSSYEITFFNKNNEIIHTQTITRTQLTSVSAGVLQTLAFGNKIRTPEQKTLDKQIEEKEKEIATEKERITKLPPIKKVKLEVKHLIVTPYGYEVNGWRDNPNGFQAPGGIFEGCKCTSNGCNWGGKHGKHDYTCAIGKDAYYVSYDKDPVQIQKEGEVAQKENDKRKQDYENKLKKANENISKCKDNMEAKWNQCETDREKWWKENYSCKPDERSPNGCELHDDPDSGSYEDYISDYYEDYSIIRDYGTGSSNVLLTNQDEYDIDCSQATSYAKKRCEAKNFVPSPTYLSTNINTRAKEDNVAFYNRINNQYTQSQNVQAAVSLGFACYFGDQKACEAAKKLESMTLTKNNEFCVSHFDPSKINDSNYNIVIDCSPYASDLEKMEVELEDLQKDLRSKTHNCEADPFSPIGGGTIFGIDSVNGDTCDLDRGEKFITDNAITSIRIVDLETKDITTKKLEFPLVFPNRIFYTYLKAVEDRRYKCCTLLK